MKIIINSRTLSKSKSDPGYLGGPWIFTPHPGEFARLSGIDKSLSLMPAFLGDVFFNDNGLRKIDLMTGFVELVMGDDGEVFGW